MMERIWGGNMYGEDMIWGELPDIVSREYIGDGDRS